MSSSNVIVLGVRQGTSVAGPIAFGGEAFSSSPPRQRGHAGDEVHRTIREEAVLRAATALRTAARGLSRRWEGLSPEDRTRALALLVSAAERMEVAVSERPSVDTSVAGGGLAQDFVT